MKRNFMALLAFWIIFSGLAEANTYLKVLDPRFNTNYKLPGSIEEFTVAVKPRGIYFEYDIYISFNSKGSQWTRDLDTLEVEYFFDLPEKAFMTDSWLWYNNLILRARIIDIWTASQIYENIVHRVRRDPSIIYRRSTTQYEMRIFPMVGNSFRKVKISYMAPATWTANSVSAQLPLWLVNASAAAPGKVRIITYPNADFKNPKIAETSDYLFTEADNKEFGHHYFTDMLPSNKFGNYNLSFDSPAQNGTYVNFNYFNSESIFQMVFFPFQALDFRPSRKILFLVDNDQYNSTYKAGDVESYLESLILGNITDKDSFNVIFSGIEPKKLSNTWIKGDRDSVLKALETLNPADLKSYSNLPSLMSAGIEFLNNNGKSGNILLISSSVSFGDYEVANEFIQEIMGRMQREYPVFVADSSNGHLQKYVINNLSYYGSEYFYTNLCRLTGGALNKIYNTGVALPTLLQNALNSLSPDINTFDFYTTLKDGMTYGKYHLSATSQNYYYYQPIMMVGKSVGSFPMTIQAGGFIKDKAFTKIINLEEKDISFNDYNNNQIWNANLMRTYENKQTKNNLDVLEIIDLSKANRVLSQYTAFLALETDVYDSTDNSTEDPDDNDDGELNAVDETVIVYDNESVFHISPNPFTSAAEITVSLPDRANSDITSIEIFDMLGRKVKVFDIAGIAGMKDFRLKWNGVGDDDNTVQNGSYVLVVSTATRKYSVKLIKI